MILFFYKIADTITSTIFGVYLNFYNFSTHNRHHLWTKLHFSHTCAAATSYDMQKWHLAFLLPWSFLTQLLGHRALLIFPLTAMLTFCQIIRKLDLIFFLTQSLQSCHWYADEISPQKSISQALLKCMHVFFPSILTKLSTLFCIRRVM